MLKKIQCQKNQFNVKHNEGFYISGETTSRLIVVIVSEKVGLRARAGFATAIIWPPEDDIT